jgi:hypothetical protein
MMLHVVATIVIAVVVVFNLLLTFGLITRMRAQQGETWSPAQHVGRVVGAFRVTATDGTELTEQLLAERETIVGFMSATCPACAAMRDKLASAQLPAPFIAFIDGDATDPASAALSAQLARLGPVAYTSRGAPVIEAFGADGYPALYRVNGGTVVAASYRLADVLA